MLENRYADALTCDFAAIYHVYDREALPVSVRATLAAGLLFDYDSLVRRRAAGFRVGLHTFLLADAADSLRLLFWAKTRDAERGRNRPASLVGALINPEPEKKKTAVVVFESAEAFEAARRRIVGGQELGIRN